MDDKVFNLLEQMQANIMDKLEKVDARFDKVEQKIEGLSNQVTKIEVEHGKKLDALFDGHGKNTESIKELSNKLDEISNKIEKHDVEISVIKRVK